MSQVERRMQHLTQMRERACGCTLCERAAIIQFDGGLSRDEAERLAAEGQ